MAGSGPSRCRITRSGRARRDQAFRGLPAARAPWISALAALVWPSVAWAQGQERAIAALLFGVLGLLALQVTAFVFMLQGHRERVRGYEGPPPALRRVVCTVAAVVNFLAALPVLLAFPPAAPISAVLAGLYAYTAWPERCRALWRKLRGGRAP